MNRDANIGHQQRLQIRRVHEVRRQNHRQLLRAVKHLNQDNDAVWVPSDDAQHGHRQQLGDQLTRSTLQQSHIQSSMSHKGQRVLLPIVDEH